MVEVLFVEGVITELQKDDAKKSLLSYWKDKIAVVWTREDVLAVAKDNAEVIDDEAADEILEAALLDHDAEQGINWDTIAIDISEGTYVHDSLVRAEIAKVTAATLEDLPLLINEVSTEEAKEILKQRLN